MPREEYPTSVRLPKDVKQALERDPDKAGRSLSWFITHILRQWIAARRAWREKQDQP